MQEVVHSLHTTGSASPFNFLLSPRIVTPKTMRPFDLHAELVDEGSSSALYQLSVGSSSEGTPPLRFLPPALSPEVTAPASPDKAHPRLGCAGIVRRGSEILLGMRNKEPNRGLWVLPGGGVDFGETFEKTIRRELAEEAGIEVDVEGVFRVYELVNPPVEHRVVVYVTAKHRKGEPTASSDLSDVRFFPRDHLCQMSIAGLISPFVETVLRDLGAL